MKLNQTQLDQVIDIAHKAGKAIMAIYQTKYSQSLKQDLSPVTEADLAAHHIIEKGLKQISDYPVLSEESNEQQLDWNNRQHWQTYWLVDPLDGTKEFINQNGEFTVNIALIHQGESVLGVVYCPAINCLYYGAKEVGSFKQNNGSPAIKLTVATEPKAHQIWKIVGSRRHGAETLQLFTQNLADVEIVSMGSSLKLCLVAEGKAHLYPRLAPTSEWDTAAAQAIVENAGGKVLTPDLLPLTYGQKQNLLNPNFIVCAKPNKLWDEAFVQICQQ